MKVINSTQSSAATTISNVSCMYENGEQGSNLQQFNATIGAGQTLGPIYIESIGSGGCYFEYSYFNLNWNNNAVTINAADSDYTSNQAPGIAVAIDNSGKQSNVVVTLYA
jgi:hypothetical protein